MKEFEIWSEGYIATGERGGATYHGTFTAVDFKAAVEKYRESLSESDKKFVNLETLTYWGCRLFDTERKARASYG